MDIRLMGEQIGAEITGVDVKTMDDAAWGKIYQTWLDHNVIIVRDQELAIEDFYNYSLRFGPVEAHPSKSTRHPDFPKITVLGVGKFDEDGRLDMAVYRRGAESSTRTVLMTRTPSRQHSCIRSPSPAVVAIPTSPACTPRTRPCRSGSKTASMVERRLSSTGAAPPGT